MQLHVDLTAIACSTLLHYLLQTMALITFTNLACPFGLEVSSMMIASNAAKRLVSASAAPRSSSAACCPCPSWLIANACPESCAGLDQCAPTRATGGSSSSLSDCTVIYTVRHWHSCVRHRVVALPARHCGSPPLGISSLRVPALCRRRTAPAQVRACAPSRGCACPPQRPACHTHVTHLRSGGRRLRRPPGGTP